MNKIDIDNIIFFSGNLDVRAGGPSGYLANLKNALTDVENIKFVFNKNEHEKKYLIPKILACFIPSKRYRKKFRRYLIRLLYKQKDWNFDTYFNYELNAYRFKTITCHSYYDVHLIKKFLKENNIEAKIIQMSHSPEPAALEAYHIEIGNNNPLAEENFKKAQMREKEAFEMSDILLFPAKESMEGYVESLSYFNDLLLRKNVKYLPTGCESIKYTDVKENFREKYNIKTKYIISYIGRHLAIKGYDSLKIIAEKCLQMRNDITFVIAGAQSNIIPPLEHERWIEVGKINPADLLAVTDLFILPNKQTYFDLVLLEVLSAGVPVIASATGGNKAVYNMTEAIDLYVSIEECIEKIITFLDSSEKNKLYRKEISRQAYEQNFTLKHFAKNYINLINDICFRQGE